MASVKSASPRKPLPARIPFFYGWVIVGMSSLGLLFSAPGQTYVISVVVDTLIEDRGWSRTLVSGLYTAGSLTAVFSVVLVGRLLDRHGARSMMPIIVLLFGGAVFLMGRVSEPVHLYLGFVAIRGLGQGALALVSTVMVAIWFVRKRGRATALASLASPLSQASFPPLVLLLISSLGWRDTWMVLALIVWGALLLPTLLLVRRSPEAVGLRPDGDPAERSPSPSGRAAPRDDDWTLGDAMRTRAFWLLLLAGTGMPLISTALTFHHMSLITGKGLGDGVAVAVLSFVGPMGVMGTLIAGYLLDRMPNRYVLAGALALYAATIMWVLVVSSPWQAFVYGGLLGLSQGLLMTTNVVIWPNYFGRAHIGSIRGVANAGMVTFSALGPLPFGYLFDLTGDYNVPILAFMALPIFCLAMSLMAVPPRRTSGDVRQRQT